VNNYYDDTLAFSRAARLRRRVYLLILKVQRIEFRELLLEARAGIGELRKAN